MKRIVGILGILCLCATGTIAQPVLLYVHINGYKAAEEEVQKELMPLIQERLPGYHLTAEPKIQEFLQSNKFVFHRTKLTPDLRKILYNYKIAYLLVGGLQKKAGEFRFLCRLIPVQLGEQERKISLSRVNLKRIKRELQDLLKSMPVMAVKSGGKSKTAEGKVKKDGASVPKNTKRDSKDEIKKKQAISGAKNTFRYGQWLFVLLAVAILTLFSYCLYTLISKGKILIFAAILQPFLFCLLYFLLSQAYGIQHYTYESPPCWYHWLQFTGIHILRAADIVDFIEEYQIDMQNIRHNSAFSGITIVCMHWMVDIFLIAWFVTFLKKRTKVLGNWWESWWRFIKKYMWYGIGAFAVLYLGTAIWQKWSILDIIIWWPLDNLLRVLDVGDSFQIFHWRLHQVQNCWWNSTLAILFRPAVGLYAGYWINIVRLMFIGGAGMTIEDLIENLGHEDFNVRQAAAEALGKIGPDARPAIPALVMALADKDYHVRKAAAEALGKIGPDARQAIPTLVMALADKDYHVRKAAAEALGKIGPDARPAIPHLVNALAGKYSSVREAAAEALEKVNPQWAQSPEARQAIPALANALANKDSSVRDAAATALEKIDPQWAQKPEARQAIPALVRALAVMHYAVRNALEKIDPQWAQSSEARQAIPALVMALDYENYHARQAAAEALGKIGPDARQAIPALVMALADKDYHVRNDYHVRKAAAEALAKIDPQWAQSSEARQAIPALVKALADEHCATRDAAAGALGEIGTKAIPALLKALTDNKHYVRKAAAETLRKIDSQWAQSTAAWLSIPALIKALADKNYHVRDAAAEALGKIGTKAIPALFKALADKDYHVRDAAAETLAKIGTEAIPTLLKALTDKDYHVRDAAAEALAKIDPPWAQSPEARQFIPTLVMALADKDYHVRKAAAEALAKIGPEARQAIPALVNSLADNDSSVRGAAAEALAKIVPQWAQSPEARQAIPALVKALADGSYNVRKAAAKTLEKIDPQLNRDLRGRPIG